MQVPDGTLDYLYDQKRVIEIREKGHVLLKVTNVQQEDRTIQLTLRNGQTIGLKMNMRPRIQMVNKQNQTTGQDESLGGVTLTNGTEIKLEYAVEEKLNPVLYLSGRKIVWDAATYQIIQNGDWKYDVTLPAGADGNAAISRNNAQSKGEYWYKNDTRGEEISEGSDGTKRITTWFTSGTLLGKLRKYTELTNGVETKCFVYSYDEKGKLIRVRNGDKVTWSSVEENSTVLTKANK